MIGGRTRARTWDPLIKSHQILLIYQAHFDISSVRSGIEPERKLENVETKIEWRSINNSRRHPYQCIGLGGHSVRARQLFNGTTVRAETGGHVRSPKRITRRVVCSDGADRPLVGRR